jgi:hypothetical protein
MSMREWLRQEIREVTIVALYFLIWFSIFLSLKKLLLEEYHVSIYVLQTAVIGALVTAKIVIVLEKTSFGNRFQDGRLMIHVIWRSFVYTAVVFAVTLIEQIVERYIAKESLTMVVSELWSGKDFDHFLAMNLSIALAFLLYNTFSEMDRRLGRGAVRRLLLSAHKDPTPAPTSGGGSRGGGSRGEDVAR